MEPIFPALLTVMGTIVVAQIGVSAVRVPMKDTRAQLLKDAELLSKLDANSEAKNVLQQHIDNRVEELIKQELCRDDRRLAKGWSILAQIYIIMGFASYAWWYSQPDGLASLVPTHDEAGTGAIICLISALMSGGAAYAHQRKARRLGPTMFKYLQNRPSRRTPVNGPARCQQSRYSRGLRGCPSRNSRPAVT